MIQDLQVGIEAVRNAPSERERSEAKSQLSGLLRARVIETLAKLACPDDLAEDIAQEKTLSLLEHLVANEVAHPRAFVNRAAKYALYDELRKRKRRGVELSLHDDPGGQHENSGGASNSGALLFDRQTAERWRAEQIAADTGPDREKLARLVRRLPEEDQRLLEAVCVHERSIEELAEEELERAPVVMRGPKQGKPRTLAQARAFVDQRLSRARKKLAELLSREDES